MISPSCTTRESGPRVWTLSSLVAEARLYMTSSSPLPDAVVTCVTEDSHQVVPGACFVAVRGAANDGHRYVTHAVSGGAVGLVIDDTCQALRGLGDVPVVRVHDTKTALARLAATFHGVRSSDVPDLRLIGVTGTNGKTTVAWMLRAILRAADQPTALLGTIEYDLIEERLSAPLTTPGAVTLCRYLARARDAGARYGVLEVSSHALDQRRCDGLGFAVGVFTNLSGDHLDYHGDMAAYFAAKRHLFTLVTKGGTAVVNLDDPAGARLVDHFADRVVTFGIDRGRADATADIRRITREGTELTMRLMGAERSMYLPLLGRHNVSNALAAAATARALGIDPDFIVRGLQELTTVPGRMQRVEQPGCPFSVLVDYAHTDAALESAVTTLRPLTEGRLICVFGCGGDRDRAKRPRMAEAASRADVVFVTSDNPRREDPDAIINDILHGFGEAAACQIFVDADRRRAIEAAISFAEPGDCVLIAGKGHEDYQIVGDKVLCFDDAKVASSCLPEVLRSGGVA